MSWTVVPNANPGTTLYGFNGVAVASSSDVWAVGYSQATAGAATETLIEHWNGSPWSIVSSPSRNAKISSLFAITVVSATNVRANEGVKFLKFSEIFQRGGVRT